MTANFSVADGRDGRMVGTLPASVDPGDDQWENHGPNNGG